MIGEPLSRPRTAHELDEVGSDDVTTPIAQLRPARVEAIAVGASVGPDGIEIGEAIPMLA